MMMKKHIRGKILSLRNKKSEKELASKSVKIQKKLFKLPEFIKAKTILFYVSTKSEVKTENMIKQALKQGKGVVVPITDLKAKTLKLSELKNFEELEPGSFGILEPKPEFRRYISPQELDLIILPGIAFDQKGYRIGYGKGFYDKLLSSVRVETVGLAYDFQIVPRIPKEGHDITVKKIVTEKRIISCS